MGRFAAAAVAFAAVLVARSTLRGKLTEPEDVLALVLAIALPWAILHYWPRR